MKRSLALTVAILVSLGSAMIAAAYAQTSENEALIIKNTNGEYLGTIKNFLIDSKGNIAFVVLSHENGQMGSGIKDIAVPLGAFSYDHENGSVVLDVSKERLEGAPEFTMSRLNDPSFPVRMNRYFGQAPAWADGVSESESVE